MTTTRFHAFADSSDGLPVAVPESDGRPACVTLMREEIPPPAFATPITALVSGSPVVSSTMRLTRTPGVATKTQNERGTFICGRRAGKDC